MKSLYIQVAKLHLIDVLIFREETVGKTDPVLFLSFIFTAVKMMFTNGFLKTLVIIPLPTFIVFNCLISNFYTIL